jgi:hypothetical protein
MAAFLLEQCRIWSYATHRSLLEPAPSALIGLLQFQTPNHHPLTPMKELYYFSRSYVEFGTFTAEEIADFRKRGILTDHDYVRSAASHDWEAVGHWLSKNGSNGAKPATTKPKAPRKKAASTKASKKAA